ncbi:cupin domain-containing protein [Leucobacter allii]|uniref:cupin domain-containing protein n=1 Tax=Leucobacter allii TaxID=2932247 RepID=UPI001FD104AA|nr:cupin domain-containing protein [Leucobacter allii]UOR02139.1 cupin domain-containing protein [Leucobacter allii]
MTRTRTRAAHDTAAADLGPHAAKPTARTAGMTEAARAVWSGGSPNAGGEPRIETGLWECTPGVFTAAREGYTEICTILSGRVTLEVEGEDPEEFGPGDVMVMPSGWTGVWRVHEPLRKHYTTILD